MNWEIHVYMGGSVNATIYLKKVITMNVVESLEKLIISVERMSDTIDDLLERVKRLEDATIEERSKPDTKPGGPIG